jgi:hypothetical protein
MPSPYLLGIFVSGEVYNLIFDFISFKDGLNALLCGVRLWISLRGSNEVTDEEPEDKDV